MLKVYKGLANLISLGVVIQATVIALAWFLIIGDLDEGTTLTEDWDYNIGHIVHAIVGLFVMPVLGLVMFIISFFTKFPGAVKWAGLIFLALVVQVVLAIVAFGAGAIGALHGLNAMVILALSLVAARRVPVEPVTRADTGTPATV